MKRTMFIIVFLMILSYQASVFSQDNKNRKESFTVEEEVVPKMSFDNNTNKLTINNAPVGKKVEVFSIIATKIRDIAITSTEFEYVLNTIPRGIYILRMEGKMLKINIVK